MLESNPKNLEQPQVTQNSLLSVAPSGEEKIYTQSKDGQCPRELIIKKLVTSDLHRLDDLGRRYRNTLGFLTSETLLEYLERGRVFGAITDCGELVGYLLYADYPDRFRIAQLCVSGAFRGQGIARLLVEALKSTASTQKIIKLRCRRDFPAYHMWPRLGFIPMDEKPGRSVQGHLLTLWCCQLDHDDELGLWKAQASDDALDVVIDAQIFYDFDTPDTSNSLISKGLLNDFLVDSLNLWITDELFLEINRKSCDVARKKSMDRAHGMPRVAYRQELADKYIETFKQILPYQRLSEKSDVHHLAKTAASKVKTFVTKDQRLLENAELIRSLVGVTVMHPSALVTSLHEITEKHSYSPTRVTGLQLQWRRMRGEDCDRLPNGCFQKHGETKGKLAEKIRSFLSHPVKYRCELLLSQSEIVAIRVIDLTEPEKLLVRLARVSFSSDINLFGDFLIADTLALAVEGDHTIVNFPSEELPDHLRPLLAYAGFKEVKNGWIKISMAKSCSRQDAQTYISKLIPDLEPEYKELSNVEFDRDCAPLASSEGTPTFLIPIKPAFAMGLIDRKQAADDLFGGNPSVLLRWDNVYYRKKSCHKMLQAPGRILWYASGTIGAIVAVSHLDEVDIGLPKDLFRKYQKFGVLEWRDLYAMCEQSIHQEIMALRFSRTFLFKRRVSLSSMRAIFQKDCLAESLQSPSQLPFHTLQKIYQIGF